jgi:hypothetical protein
MGLKARFTDGDARRPRFGPLLSTIFDTGLRFLQFIFGIAVIGLYTQDINRSRNARLPADPRWVCVLPHFLLRDLTFLPSLTFLLQVYQAGGLN